MEIKINKEIRDYTESVFFDLSLRQFVCALCAVGAAVGCYFGLRNIVGVDVTTWLCIVAAVPFAALGFVKYNGLNAEQFAMAWLRSELLLHKPLPYLEGGAAQ